MRISFTPQARFDALSVQVSGDVITIDGEQLDFSALPDGHSVPFKSKWSAGPARREGGVLHIPLIYPHGGLKPGVVPGVVVIDAADGSVEVPHVD